MNVFGIVMVWSFLILLAVAVVVREVGSRLVPLVMPHGRLKAVVVGFVGAVVGNLLGASAFGFIPEVADVNLLGAVLGAAVFVVALGLLPFIKILIGRI